MNISPIAIIMLIAGGLMLTFGFIASDSIASSFSRLFTGEPTDKAIFLLIGGAVALGIGLIMSLRPGKS